MVTINLRRDDSGKVSNSSKKDEPIAIHQSMVKSVGRNEHVTSRCLLSILFPPLILLFHSLIYFSRNFSMVSGSN